MTDFLFTYGTLRNLNLKGESGEAISLGTYRTKPEYSLYDFHGYPGMFEGGENIVIGEIINLTGPYAHEWWRVFDRIESEGRMYDRKEIDIPDFGKVQAYLARPNFFYQEIALLNPMFPNENNEVEWVRQEPDWVEAG